MRPRHRKKERQPSPIQNQTKSVRIEKEKKGRYSRKEYRAMYRREVLRRIITGGRKIVFLPYKRIIRKTQELQKISPPLPKSYQNRYSYEQNQKVQDMYAEAHNNGDQSGDIYPLQKTYPQYHWDVFLESQTTRRQVNALY